RSVRLLETAPAPTAVRTAPAHRRDTGTPRSRRLNPGGGAVTSVVPSGLSLDTPAQYLGEALTDGLYLDGLSVGAALQEARRTTTGSVQPFVSRMYNVVGDPAVVAR
ncbi:MAG: hypothetical protein ACPG1A_04010, partial [Halioglobus sp.]